MQISKKLEKKIVKVLQTLEQSKALNGEESHSITEGDVIAFIENAVNQELRPYLNSDAEAEYTLAEFSSVLDSAPVKKGYVIEATTMFDHEYVKAIINGEGIKTPAKFVRIIEDND